MRHASPWIFACSVFVSLGAQATSPMGPPAVVGKAVQEVAAMCREVGGKPDTSGAVKIVDLNGDGKPDYVFDIGDVNCDGAASVYGDREKGVMVFVGDGAGGAREAFNGMSYGTSVEGTGPAAKLWLRVSSGDCGKPPAKDFASESFCDRALAWNAKSQAFEFAPVATVRMIQ